MKGLCFKISWLTSLPPDKVSIGFRSVVDSDIGHLMFHESSREDTVYLSTRVSRAQ